MNEYVVEEFEHEGCTIEILYDVDNQGPLVEYDEATRFDFGADIGDWVRNHNDHPFAWDEFGEDSEEAPSYLTEYFDYDCLPYEWVNEYVAWLSKHDPHGVYIPTRAVADRQFHAFRLDDDKPNGVLYLTSEDIRREYGDTSDASRESARYLIAGEIHTLMTWIQGDVYGYVVKDDEGNVVGSCWGFYGAYGSEGWKEMIEAAKNKAEYVAEKRRERYSDVMLAMDQFAQADLLGVTW